MPAHVDESRGLERIGFPATTHLHWDLGAPQLYEDGDCRGEATLAAEGPLVARTGQHTGRAPNDKFIVDDATSRADIDWGAINRPIDERTFDLLQRDLMAHLRIRLSSDWTPSPERTRNTEMPIRVITELGVAQPVRPQHVHHRDRACTNHSSIDPSSPSSTCRHSRPIREGTALARMCSSSCISPASWCS